MRKVKNKQVIRRVADRTRKAGRGRNIIAVLAIALTTLLFTSVFTIGGSLVEKTQQETMRQVGGSAHAGFKYLTQEEYDILKKDPKLKEVSRRILVGEAVNDDLKKLRTEVGYYEDLEAKFSFCYPEKGHMPEKEDEIVTSDLVLKELGIPLKLGTKVPIVLDIDGKRIEKVFTLSGYFKGDLISMSQLLAVSKEYAAAVAPTPKNSVLKTGADASQYAGRIMADFNFRTSFNLEKQTEELAKRCGFPEETAEGINWAYMGNQLDMETMLPVAVLLLVIFVSGYLIIYNIFYINVYHDIQHYGLLKTIGTTGRQLRSMVRHQAFVLSLYGIPAGLILGAVMGKALLPVMMNHLVFAEISGTGISLKPWIFLGAALFSLLTVYISCIRPCRIASSVSPVEAVRYTEGNAVKGKKKRKKTKKVSPWQMAYANLARNKKKAVIVVASLSLALILTNSIYGIVRGFDMEKYVAARTVSDFSVTDASVDNLGFSGQRVLDGVTKKFLSELEQQKGIKSIGNVYLKMYDEESMTQEERTAFIEIIKKYPGLQKQIEQMCHGAGEGYFEYLMTEAQVDGKVYGIGRLIMEKLQNVEGPLDWEKFSSGRYVIAVRYSHADDGQIYDYYHVGDKVTIRQKDGTSREYEVLAMANMPYSAELQSYGMMERSFLMPDTEFLDFYGEQQPLKTLFNVENDKEASVEKWLSNYCENVEDDLKYTSKGTIVAEFDSIKSMYVIVGGLLALVLAMIGILNFVNTMVTSVLSRRQELAMMEAVGMTPKQQKQMLWAEGIYYAVFTVTAALVFGSIVSITVIQKLGGQFFFFTWHFSVLPIVLCIPVLLLVVLIVPTLCYSRLGRDSVVKRMAKAE